ncbi:MAG: hypothetical protein JST82_14020 [Bacteroidetes bacterium]|nr:hypothetical protein [Bacteroidota bacterium]
MLESLKNLYKEAVQTALLAHDNITGEWYHLFSVIELLPEDILSYNIPNDEWKHNTVRAKLSSKTDSYSFYLTINPIKTIEEALKTFSNPIGNTKISNFNIQFFNSAFIAEPSNEYPLIFSSNIYSRDGLDSVLPRRDSGLYAWTRIDYLRVVQNLFDSSTISKDMKAMSQLTNDWLGFDIWEKPEHLGNIYLSAPNPYYRDIDISLSQDPVGIFYNIKTRKGIKNNFVFRAIDKHGDAIALDKTYKITNNFGLLPLPHEPHLFQLKIYDLEGNLIAFREPAVFLKSIQMNMAIKQADFHVNVKSDDGDVNHVIEKYSAEKPSVIGKPTDFNAAYYFKHAASQRKHIEHKETNQFILFLGGKTIDEKLRIKTGAKEKIREIINLSNETCYLCDPYFNSKDLIEYAFYIKNSGVTIRVLNSKEFINKDEAKNIEEVLKEYNSKPFGKIEVHTLRGKSILHDRFIVIDKNVWLIGSSFNEFGSRATTIAKVPDSSQIEIIKEIEKWFFNTEFSQPIEDYANE